MPLVQPAFEKCPRIHARSGVALKENNVAGKTFRVPTEEMVEADLVKRRCRGIRRDVAADVRGGVGLDDHCHRVPTDDALDAALDDSVARIRRLLLHRNRVEVRRGHAGGRTRRGAKLAGELLQQFGGALRPLTFQRQFKNRLQRLAPFVAVPVFRRSARRAGARTVNFFFINVHCDTC